MKRVSTTIVAALMAVSGVTLAADASLSSIEGSALVNAGQDYQQATVGMDLEEKYLVMVMEGSKAVVTYENGCERTIEGPQIYTVDGEACVIGVVPGAVFGNMVTAEAVTYGVIVGAVVIGGSGGGDGDKDRPVSP